MNAIALLEADHKTVEALFTKVESTGENEHPALFEQIKTELEAHAYVEETIFYPAIQEDGDEELRELTSEAKQEHLQMKNFLGELSVVAADQEKFESLLATLISDTRHHVEEEEGQMFPMVRAQFDAATIEEWGGQMEAEKARFQASTESFHA